VPVLPAVSVWVAVRLCGPSLVRLTLVLQLPLRSTSAEPTDVMPSHTVTLVPNSPVPPTTCAD